MAEGGKGEATKAMGDEEGQGRARGRQGRHEGWLSPSCHEGGSKTCVAGILRDLSCS